MLKSEFPTKLLWSARFRFKRLSEASLIAAVLSETCPNSPLTRSGLMKLMNNAIECGNLGISFEEKLKLELQCNLREEVERRLKLPEHRDKFVEVIYERLDHEIRITIIDQGKGFDRKKCEPSHPEKLNAESCSRGVLLAEELIFKEVHYSEACNEVMCIILI